MQNFIDHRIKERTTREFRRMAVGNTEETPMDNGDSAFNARWRYNKMKYVAKFAIMAADAQNEIAAAFHAARARLLLVRYRDYGDYKVAPGDGPLAPIAGTRTPIQLTKTYTYGPATGERMIQAVDACKVYDSEDNEVAGVLDNCLGLFTPDENWADVPHYWLGRFSIWVRFASDVLDMTMLNIDITTADVELNEGRAHR